MKISYTESGKQELEAFHHRQQKLLEQIVSEKKYVFGDEEIEVTASDIREASDHIRVIRRSQKKMSYLSDTLPKLYMLLGAIIVCVGLAFPYANKMLNENPTQLMIILAGALFIFLGYVMGAVFSIRRKQLKMMIEESEAKSELILREQRVRDEKANK